jgi:CRISPR system Cascade subunit CasE
MTELFLVRARLRRDAPAAALAAPLVPKAQGAQAGAAHRLVWSLFADASGRQRDFLWRQTGPGAFLALAARPPTDPHNLFALEHKPFTPELRAGQRLRFSLRANPVVASAPAGKGQRGKRRDVVMHALYSLPSKQRAEERAARTHAAGSAWLVRQGARYGFEPDPERLSIDGHDQVRIPRDSAPPIAFSVLEFDGVLTVRDPELFLGRVAIGFGAARAFGCGLMLIRRAPASAEAG